MITSVNGIVLKLYGHWLHAEHQGSLLFINPKLEDVRELMLVKERCVEEENESENDSNRLNDLLESHIRRLQQQEKR